MKKPLTIPLLCLCIFCIHTHLFTQTGNETAISNIAQSPKKHTEKMQWWRDAKFGMFVHWGLYSVTAGDWNGHQYEGNEHFMLYEKIPVKTYGAIGKQFNPTKFNADGWAKMASDAGMEYMVITVKHHDGFAMYNSPSSNYNVVKMTPFSRDPMKDLAIACKKYDLKLCFYYSLGRDWQDPDVPTDWPVKAGRSNVWDYPDEDKKDLNKYIERKVKPQLKELLTQYGPVGVIWFDTPELITKAQSEDLEKFIHAFQPNCIINNRIGNGLGDFKVSEQKIKDAIDTAAWESCVTMSGGWGYNKYDTVWKSPELTIRQLTEIVSNGGNFLLNIGPMGNGLFPPQAVERLAIIGRWMKINSEAIYGTSPWKIAGESANKTLVGAKTNQQNQADKTMLDALNDATSKEIFPEIRFTTKGNALYLFANSFNTPNILVKSLGKTANINIQKIELLGSAKTIHYKQTPSYLHIKMSPKNKGAINVFVFKITMQYVNHNILTI